MTNDYVTNPFDWVLIAGIVMFGWMEIRSFLQKRKERADSLTELEIKECSIKDGEISIKLKKGSS